MAFLGIGAMSAHADVTLNLSGPAYPGLNNVNVTPTGTTPATYAGPAGALTGSLLGAGVFDGTSFVTYCVELGQSFGWGPLTGYNLVTPTAFSGADPNNGWGVNCVAIANRLGQLLTYALPLATNNANSTALQLAIWNTIYDTDNTLAIGGAFTDSSSYAAQASTYLANSLSTVSTLQIGVLTSSDNQDFVAYAPVPEPGTYALTAEGLGVMGFVARRRSRNARSVSLTLFQGRLRPPFPVVRGEAIPSPAMPLPATLPEWLAHCEQLHPKTIDLTLARMQVVRDRLALSIAAPLAIVAGTNGKGSSCAMLEVIALQAGYRVALHTSPHLVHFEERCRINGQAVSADALLPHFEAVERARRDLPLTFFEFTLLAIVRLFIAEAPDLIILEVGLGGRFDAVNAFDADCALITSIALDHMDFLGDTREAIGFEKAGIMRAGHPVVVSDPVPPQSVIDHATAIGADLRLSGRDFGFEGDRQQWNWFGRERRYTGLAHPALRGANQLLNAAGVLAVFEALRERLPVTAQAVRGGLARVTLPGRFQIIPGQPTLVLDVAHNPHAVATLAHNLDQMGFFACTHAVFGAMKDKDIAQMLCKVGPLIDTWHFTDLPTPRASSATDLRALLETLVGEGKYRAPKDAHVLCHRTPVAALGAALAAADPADRIIVFGSFFTVGGVLESGLPGLAAKQPV